MTYRICRVFADPKKTREILHVIHWKNSPKSENALENEQYSRATKIVGNIKKDIPFNGQIIIVRGRNFQMNQKNQSTGIMKEAFV